MTFWYHSQKTTSAGEFGGQNELHIDLIQDDGTQFVSVGHRRGPDGDDWHQMLIDLRPFSSLASGIFRVRFRVNNLNNIVSSSSFSHDIAIDDFRIGSFDYFGTGDDLVLKSVVNQGGGELSPTEELLPGDALWLGVASPDSTFDGLPPAIVCQLHLDGVAPGNILPDLHMDLGGLPAFVLLDGSQPVGLFGPQLLDPGADVGVAINVPVILPPSLRLRAQALVSTPQAANGIYATSLMHSLDIQ